MDDRKPAQQAHAERALEMVNAIEAAPRPDNTMTANKGIISTPRADYPPSGAFDAEGHEPALRRSRER